jgi:hypothetical protein
LGSDCIPQLRLRLKAAFLRLFQSILGVPECQPLGDQFSLDRLQRLLNGLLGGPRLLGSLQSFILGQTFMGQLVWRSRMVICASSSDRSARSLAIVSARMTCRAASS